MKNNPGIVFIVLCIAAIFIAGCTNQTAPASIPIPTSTPTPVTTIPLIVPTTSPNETTTPTIVPITTRSPQVDPTDVAEITFLRYSDSDFSVDYPATWTITNSSYTQYYCQNVLDSSRTDYHLCFENETKSIGPFNFYENDNFKKPSRIVTFTSADGTLKFVSFISDFLDSRNGDWILTPSMGWAKSEFEVRYPDLTAAPYITNYRFFKSENMLTSTFDVRLPGNTTYNPSAYTEKAVVTLHHVYMFAFTTDNIKIDNYRDLNDRILSSIKINDVP